MVGSEGGRGPLAWIDIEGRGKGTDRVLLIRARNLSCSCRSRVPLSPSLSVTFAFHKPQYSYCLLTITYWNRNKYGRHPRESQARALLSNWSKELSPSHIYVDVMQLYTSWTKFLLKKLSQFCLLLLFNFSILCSSIALSFVWERLQCA